jgi:tripartite ATP-independent transporter DctP family solute receptor
MTETHMFVDSASRSPLTPRRRRSGVLSLCLVGVLLVACSDSDSAGADGKGGSLVWRFAIEEAAGSVQDAYAQEFKRRIEERSSGEVQVKVYPYGTLGTSDDITEQLRMGSLQFAMASPGHLGKTIPELQVFLLHFILSDDDDVNRAAIGDPRFRAEIAPLFPEKELELLALLPEGWMVWTTQKPIRRPEDFQGVKIRTMTSPLLLAAYEAYGASPQAMPYGEVYSALQLNMIDAQVNPVFAIEEMSFFEVTSHMIFARPALFMTTFVSNTNFLADLDPRRRTMVLDVARELDAFLFDAQKRTNAERLEVIRERKPDMVMIELTAEERDAFRRKSAPVRERFVQMSGERGRAIMSALISAVAKAEAVRGPIPEAEEGR